MNKHGIVKVHFVMSHYSASKEYVNLQGKVCLKMHSKYQAELEQKRLRVSPISEVHHSVCASKLIEFVLYWTMQRRWRLSPALVDSCIMSLLKSSNIFLMCISLGNWTTRMLQNISCEFVIQKKDEIHTFWHNMLLSYRLNLFSRVSTADLTKFLTTL